MIEKQIYEKLRLAWRNHRLTSFQFARVLNFPDIYYYQIGPSAFPAPGWLELKVVNTVRSKIEFRKGQLTQFIEMVQSGVRVSVLIFCERNNFYHLVLPANIEAFKYGKCLQDLPVGSCQTERHLSELLRFF